MRFARASLKRAAPSPWPARRSWLSRAFCAGLIEASSASRTPRIRRPTLSRAFCAGLIEAGCKVKGAGYVLGYPVRFARASLKRKRSLIGMKNAPSYPVRFARASLKRGTRGRAPRRPGRYPVRFARASLKPIAFRRPARNTTRYPVRFARASLKPAGAYAVERRSDVIPCVLRGPH